MTGSILLPFRAAFTGLVWIGLGLGTSLFLFSLGGEKGRWENVNRQDSCVYNMLKRGWEIEKRERES